MNIRFHKSILIGFTALFVASTSLMATAADLYDVENFDIGGAKLRMTPDEAKQKLGQTYSFNPDEMEGYDADLSDRVPELVNVVDRWIHYGDKTIVRVSTRANMEDKDKGYLTVASIRLKYRKEFKDAAKNDLENFVEKYGPATFDNYVSERRWSYKWCTELNVEGDDCALGTPNLKVEHDKTSLQLDF